MERIRISALAKSLGTSTTTVYKHMKRLETRISAHVTKDGGVTFITTEGAAILKGSIQATTANPSAAIALPIPVPMPAHVDLAPVVHRLELMERALYVMVDEIKGLKQENAALRLRLEPPPLPAEFNKPAEPVKVWKPEQKADPLEGAGILTRAWAHLVHPERLRRHVS